MPPRRVLFATFGSLGDLHPYVALARELERRGHAAAIATTDVHAAAVRARGIAFVPLHPLESQLGTLERHIDKVLERRRGPEYLVKELVMPYARQAYEDLLFAARDADVLVTHPLAVAGRLVAEKTGLPWIATVLSPMSLLSAIDAPVFPGAPWLGWVRRLGVLPYRALFRLASMKVRRWEQPLALLRAEIGLPPAPPALMEGQFSPALNLALFSPVLAKPQRDWPRNTVLCGFPSYDGTQPGETTRSALEDFLAAGEPPIVFTLGSSAFAVAGDFWASAVDAAQRLGRRALLITGKGEAETPWVQGAVAAFAYLPYSLVFPRAAAVVHQGGIGTLAQALAAGCPQLILPVAFDQDDNAARAVRLGAARSLPFRKANGQRLAAELKPLLEEARYARRSRELGEQLTGEDGAVRGADLIAALSR
jgi:UDP:flavonoid glycosyltransferase YjiC (YdhE family)